ncbi:pre-mRNA-splicing factor SLU7 [Tanacetum coccineum]
MIDVDIGSSSVARSVIGLVLGYVTSLVVDLAILIEGREEKELPEYDVTLGVYDAIVGCIELPLCWIRLLTDRNLHDCINSAIIVSISICGHQHVTSTSMNNVEASYSNSRVPRISGPLRNNIVVNRLPDHSMNQLAEMRLPFPSSFPWISALNDQMLYIAPEDNKLLQEDVSAIPVKKDGLNGKERPKDIGMSWLVKTQYISPLSTDAARQARRDMRALRGLLMPSNNIQLTLRRLNPVRNTGRKQKELQEARKAGLAPVEVDEDGKEINPHIRQYMLVKPFYLQLKPESPSLKHQKNWKSNSSNTKSWYDKGVRILQAHKHMKGACAQVKFSCSFKPFGELYNN